MESLQQTVSELGAYEFAFESRRNIEVENMNSDERAIKHVTAVLVLFTRYGSNLRAMSPQKNLRTRMIRNGMFGLQTGR